MTKTKNTLKTYRVSWHIDVEARSALEAVRKVAAENFQTRIAEGLPGTACVFECREVPSVTVTPAQLPKPVTIDLAEHRYELECCHADTCLSDYWSGHHLAHVQVPVWNGMSLAELKKALMSELAEGAIAGSGYPGDHDEQWYAAARFAVHALEAKTAAGAENLFPLLEPQSEEEDAPTVYAFFVFRELEAPDDEADDGLPDDEADDGLPDDEADDGLF